MLEVRQVRGCIPRQVEAELSFRRSELETGEQGGKEMSSYTERDRSCVQTK